MKSGTPQTPLSFTAYHLLADYRSRLTWSWFFERFCSLALIVVLGTLSYTLISQFVFQSLTVSGTSMAPTLFDRGNYWLNRFVYLYEKPHRTDIVALKDPQDGILVVKRIIAMPGESIYLNKGKVYVNGKLLTEPYISKYTPTFAYEGKRAVRRRRDAVLADRNAACGGDLDRHLGARQHAAVAWLGALADLYLDHLDLRGRSTSDSSRRSPRRRAKLRKEIMCAF